MTHLNRKIVNKARYKGDCNIGITEEELKNKASKNCGKVSNGLRCVLSLRKRDGGK